MDIRIDLTETYLETDRLILRFWEQNDLEDFYEYAKVKGVGELAGWQPHSSIEESERILDMFIRHKNVLAIYHKKDDLVIGSIGLNSSWANLNEDVKDFKMKEIGYALSKDYWGQGLMLEALLEVISYCLNELNLDALTCQHFAHNIQSKKLIDKLNFTFVQEEETHCLALKKNFISVKYIKLLTYF